MGLQREAGMKVKNIIYFRRNKYGAKKKVVDGIAFDSGAEGDYYGQLKLEKRCGLIKDYERQVSFDLYAWGPLCVQAPKSHKVCRHIVDFLVTLPDGSREVSEVKGYRDGAAYALWDLKRKLFEFNYPEIRYKVVF
jgi:hypothetical protein